MTNLALGDATLRPYVATDSCDDDQGLVDTHVDLIEILTDRDGDGLADLHEDVDIDGAVGANESDPLIADNDGDGSLDGFDNCSLVGNANQRDSNGDGIGNLCDGDLDNDGVVSTPDLVIFRNVLFTANSEDADFDGDGVVSTPDLVLFRQMLFREPGPSGVAP